MVRRAMLKLSARQINQLPYIVTFKAVDTFLLGYSIYSMKDSIEYGVYEIYPVSEAFEDVRIATKACTPIHIPGTRKDILFEINPKFKFFEKFKAFLVKKGLENLSYMLDTYSFISWAKEYETPGYLISKKVKGFEEIQKFLINYFK